MDEKDKKKKLTKPEIARMIEPRIVKITTPTTQGTGYLLDAEKGIVLTNAHLFMNAQLPELTFNCDKKHLPQIKHLAAILRKNGYLDDHTRLTPKFMKSTWLDIEELVLSKGGKTSVQTIEATAATLLSNKLKEMHPSSYNSDDDTLLKKLSFDPQPVTVHYSNFQMLSTLLVNAKKQKETYVNYLHYDLAKIKITGFYDGYTYGTSLGKNKFININENEKNKITRFDFKSETLSAGDRIYYSGYPLDSDTPSFSTGYISSFSQKNGNLKITFDGAIMPGNSGSPVFIQKELHLYFIGLIKSEIAYITEDINTLRQQTQNSKNDQIRMNGVNYAKLTKSTFSIMLQNFSTGKGNIVPSSVLNTIFNDFVSPQLLFDSDFNFIVPRTKKEEKPKLHEHINIKSMQTLSIEELLQYIEMYGGEKELQAVNRITSVKEYYENRGTVKTVYSRLALGEWTRALKRSDLKPVVLFNKRCNNKEHYLQCQRAAVDTYLFLFDYASKLCRGKVSQLRTVYADSDSSPANKTEWVTPEFRNSHVMGGSNRTAKLGTVSFADERFKTNPEVTASTTILKNRLVILEKESEARQDEYKKTRNHLQLFEKNIIYSIFYKTEKKYRLFEITKVEKEKYPDFIKSYFFYSVVKKGTRFCIHHFETSNETKIREKAERQKMTVKQLGTTGTLYTVKK